MVVGGRRRGVRLLHPTVRWRDTSPVVIGRPLRLLGCAVLLVLVACGGHSNDGRSGSPPGVTPCSELIPGCTARRLPDVVLTGDDTHGILGSTDGIDMTGVMSSDQALRQVNSSERQPEAKTVRVILGAADPAQAGGGSGLYYVIEWAGVPEDPSITSDGSPIACIGTEAAILDARSGDYLGGSGSCP
jgi:hypothetical protein